jgi:hypothetical protein
MRKLSDDCHVEEIHDSGHSPQFLRCEVLTKRILKPRGVDRSLDGHEQRRHCFVDLDRQPCVTRQAQPHCQGNLRIWKCSSQLGNYCKMHRLPFYERSVNEIDVKAFENIFCLC